MNNLKETTKQFINRMTGEIVTATMGKATAEYKLSENPEKLKQLIVKQDIFGTLRSLGLYSPISGIEDELEELEDIPDFKLTAKDTTKIREALTKAEAIELIIRIAANAIQTLDKKGELGLGGTSTDEALSQAFYEYLHR